MSESSETSFQEYEVEELLEVISIASSDEPPPEEWSSMVLVPCVENEKLIAFEKGLYSPGSGEICTKYIAQSDSDICRHIYYYYPCVKDPGIETALVNPYPQKKFDPNGQDLYVAACKEMRQEMLEIFRKNLLENTINLRKYSFNPNGVRAMAIALENNAFVETLSLAENFLNSDACFHLGDLLTKNVTIKELNLEGCRIQAQGLNNVLWGCLQNKTLQVLNVNRNFLNDEGGILLGNAFRKGLKIVKLYASYNNFGSDAALALAEGFQYNNKLSHLDLSWNNLFSTKGTLKLLAELKESKCLESLNLSWNSLADIKIAKRIAQVLCTPKFKHMDLSNNQLKGEAIECISVELRNAKRLETLNLSNNPMSCDNATSLLSNLKHRKVKIKNLLMDNVMVDNQFMQLLAQVKSRQSRKNTIITYGYIKTDKVCIRPDIRDIVLDRIQFLCEEVSSKIHIAIIVYQLIKDGFSIMDTKAFDTEMKKRGVLLGKELINDSLAPTFPGPKKKKGFCLDLKAMADFIKRKWPDQKLPEVELKGKKRIKI